MESVTKDPQVSLRPFRKDAYDQITVIGTIIPIERNELLRKYSKNAYSEVNIIAEKAVNVDDYLKFFREKASTGLERAAHYSGILILLSIVAACVWIILSNNYPKDTNDNAIKFIILILGAVLGTLFPSRKSNSE